ncbi:MAG: hypothetical protein ACR2QE_06340 [Acidimicrobiales bacterium]
MQIVYLTARPSVLAQTLDHVGHYMPFIDQVVAVCPAAAADAVATISGIEVITDEHLTGQSAATIAAWDHTTRNFRLRAAMADHPVIAEEFVMADDDNRPLQAIDRSFFTDNRGRTRNYWFTELDAWKRDETPFDQGLTHALLVLRQLGVDRPLAYASHQPQLIDRALFGEAVGRVMATASRYPLDEWSIYFNLARAGAPERFAPPEPFVTLGWPQFPGEWLHMVPPAGYLFENHHPELYQPGGLFEGLPTDLVPETADADNLEKAVRWHRFGLALGRLDIDDAVTNPYTQGKPHRRAFMRGTRSLRKVVEYATIAEREALTDLTGRVRRLEQRLDELAVDDDD